MATAQKQVKLDLKNPDHNPMLAVEERRQAEIAELKKSLSEADARRRDLLASAFFTYGDDVDAIVRKLFAHVPASVLAEIESVILKS